VLLLYALLLLQLLLAPLPPPPKAGQQRPHGALAWAGCPAGQQRWVSHALLPQGAHGVNKLASPAEHAATAQDPSRRSNSLLNMIFAIQGRLEPASAS
jgi:hypothetical protein